MTDATGPRGRSELEEAIQLAHAVEKQAKPARRKSRRRAKIGFPSEKEELSASAIKRRDMSQTSHLRLVLAWFAIIAVSAQLLIANIFFGFYLWQTAQHGFESSVMIAWLSATVVEVIGIVVIVARNLFPSAVKGLSRSHYRRLVRLVETRHD